MQGKATLMGHPIHPMLVPFPIAFFSGAVISDIISAYSANPVWPMLSVVLIGFGIIGALLAALFGFIDYLTAPLADQAKRTATVHMWLNLFAVVLFIAAFFVRFDKPPSTAGYALTIIGIIIVAIAGSLGGHLAYHFGVGVDDARVPPSRSLPGGAGHVAR